MSMAEALRKRKVALHPTETTVTQADGSRHVERGLQRIQLATCGFGFVVDTAPDATPVKIVEHLYLGSQDAAVADVLQQHNITHLLSVGVQPPPTESADVVIASKHLPCLDLPDTRLADILDEACAFIDAAVAQRCNVLVHCNAGVSRSPAVVIAYLIRRRRMTYHDAHAHVKRLRPSIRPNDGFASQLQLERPFLAPSP